MGSKIKLIDGFQDDTSLRQAFHRLTQQTFGFDLEAWYRGGFWDSRYTPYSLHDGKEILSNVSVSRFRVILDDVRYNAMQIGTVMTHPKHRGKGYARRLMETALEKETKAADFVFLIANLESAEMYRKFGFKRLTEQRCISVPFGYNKLSMTWRKVNTNDPENLRWMHQLARRRTPISRRFAHLNCEHLFMYHVLYSYPDDIYYDDNTGSLILCRQLDSTLHIYDIIAPELPSTRDLLSRSPFLFVDSITFHFTPDLFELNDLSLEVVTEDVMMVLNNQPALSVPFTRPKTIEA